jgi:hypothetical protein
MKMLMMLREADAGLDGNVWVPQIQESVKQTEGRLDASRDRADVDTTSSLSSCTGPNGYPQIESRLRRRESVSATISSL